MSIEKLITDLTAAIEKNTETFNKIAVQYEKAWSDKMNDGVPAFAKQAKEAAAQKTATAAVNEGLVSSVTDIADAPKKRGPKPKAAAPEPTVYDKLCILVTQLVDNNQTDKIVKVFDQFGVKKASQLAPEHHQEAWELLSGEVDEPVAEASFV